MTSTFLRTSCAIVLVQAGAAAQVMWTWTPVATTGPPGLEGHAMTFDIHRGRTVLFGGATIGGTDAGDTWEWDGSAWLHAATTGPSARRNAAMAFDDAGGLTVLFGGMTTVAYPGPNVLHGDTWVWDGAAWSQRTVSTGPSARHGHAVAFDTARGRVVLFGGLGNATYLADTWEWDGSAWFPAAVAGPPARADHAMAYDSLRGKVVLYGGAVAPSGVAVFHGDTWEWDGNTWTQVANSGPSPRSDHTMVFDSQRGRTVLSGGWNGTIQASTWEWDGATWTLPNTTGGAPTYANAASYDSSRSRTVLYGGTFYLSSTWELVPSGNVAVATVTAYGSGCGSPPLTIAPRGGSRPLIGQSQVTDVDGAFLGISLMAWGLSDEFWGAVPLPATLAPFGFSGCMLWHSADGDLGLGCASTSWNTAENALPIPSNQVIVGVHLYLQAWTLQPGYNPAGIVTSNGIELLIGDY